LADARAVTVRALALFVFAAEEDIDRARAFAESVSDRICFARYPFAQFRADHSNVRIDEEELPAIAMLDRRKKSFRLIRRMEFDEDAIRRLDDDGGEEMIRLCDRVAGQLSGFGLAFLWRMGAVGIAIGCAISIPIWMSWLWPGAIRTLGKKIWRTLTKRNNRLSRISRAIAKMLRF
jgi:hypothetical protein